MLPTHARFPSRGAIARRPTSRRNAQAMLPPPPPGPNIGAFANLGTLPQDVAGAVIGQLRTSMLDVGTAVRLGGRGRRVHFGTELAPPQAFTSPSNPNSADNLRAGIKQAGNARRAEGKNANRGLRRATPGAMI